MVFSKGDQLDPPKMGQMMFLIRYCNLTGNERKFSNLEKWVTRGWFTKNRTNVKKLKTEKFH
jgi:hypothetical protein